MTHHANDAPGETAKRSSAFAVEATDILPEAAKTKTRSSGFFIPHKLMAFINNVLRDWLMFIGDSDARPRNDVVTEA